MNPKQATLLTSVGLLGLVLFITACVPTSQSQDDDDDGAGDGGDGGADGGDGSDGGDGGVGFGEIDPSSLPEGNNPCRSPEFGTVAYAVDGDTIEVELRSGGSERVRIIGVDTPESYGDVECYGPEASLYTAQELEGEEVWLTFDGTCIDSYDRTLAYVHTGNQSEEDFFERRLLRYGYAEAFPFDNTDTFEAEFEADMQVAIAGGAGLWSACN
jgi:micrococcal nuclease